MKWRIVAFVITLLLFVLIVSNFGPVLFFNAVRLVANVTQLATVTCYVGVTGSAASITVSGPGAGAVCDKIVSSNPRTFYRMSNAPTQAVICEQTIQGYRAIVRDEGMFKFVGNGLCLELQKWVRTP